MAPPITTPRPETPTRTSRRETPTRTSRPETPTRTSRRLRGEEPEFEKLEEGAVRFLLLVS